jgi:hypothetical protein
MAEKPTKEEKAGKPNVDLDRLETAMAAEFPPADTAQPVHTEDDGQAGEADAEAQPDPLAATNPIEELVDSQTQEVLDGLEDLRSEVQRLIDDIRSSRAKVVLDVTEHARRTALGAKAASTITEHLARVRQEFAPPA